MGRMPDDSKILGAELGIFSMEFNEIVTQEGDTAPTFLSSRLVKGHEIVSSEDFARLGNSNIVPSQCEPLIIEGEFSSENLDTSLLEGILDSTPLQYLLTQEIINMYSRIMDLICECNTFRAYNLLIHSRITQANIYNEIDHLIDAIFSEYKIISMDKQQIYNLLLRIFVSYSIDNEGKILQLKDSDLSDYFEEETRMRDEIEAFEGVEPSINYFEGGESNDPLAEKNRLK